MKTHLDREFIERKLQAIALYIRRLHVVLESSDADIRDDFFKLHTLERLIQLIVDEIVDINTHVIRYGDFSVPDDFQSSFLVLAEGGVFPRDFAERIAPTVGLRNRLVHRYEAIDPILLIRMARAESGDFREYAEYILRLFSFYGENQNP